MCGYWMITSRLKRKLQSKHKHKHHTALPIDEVEDLVFPNDDSDVGLGWDGGGTGN